MKLKLKKPPVHTKSDTEGLVLEDILSPQEVPQSVQNEVQVVPTKKDAGEQLKRDDPVSPPKKKLITEEGSPRWIDTGVMLWKEVFASKKEEETIAAKKVLLKNVMSTFIVLDHEKSEFLLMTTDTFWFNALSALEVEGFKVYGVLK